MKKLFVGILYSTLVSVCISQTLSPPYEYQPDANTMLLMHMNETSGTTVSDASTYGNNGNATAGATITGSGKFNNARTFDGNSEIDISYKNTSLYYSAGDFTAEMWARTTSTSAWQRVLARFTGTNKVWTVEIGQTAAIGVPAFALQGLTSEVDIQGKTAINDGRWHHVAAQRQNGIGKIYVDGVLESSLSASQVGSTDSTMGDLIIGYPSPHAFIGSIDEVRISNIARSPQEFNLQLPPVNLTAIPSGTTVNLSWQNGGGAVPLMRYKIYRGSDSTNVTLVDSTTSTSRSQSGLGTGLYYYRVSAVDSTGFEGAKSWAAIATVSGASLPPTITSFTPTSGPIGTTVTITGTNFNTTAANNIVYFGAAKTTITNATATSLIVNVPVGATYAQISVTDTTTGLSAYTSQPFLVTFSGGSAITDSSFGSKFELTTGTNPISIAISDYDGDGKPDLAVLNSGSNTLSLLRNASSPGVITFAAKVDSLTGSQPYHVVARDLDGDGKPDLIIVNHASNDLTIYRNVSTTGTIAFSARVTLTTGAGPEGVRVDDFDADGKPDIAVALNGTDSITIFRNISTKGNIAFSPRVSFIVGNGPFYITSGDIDLDSKPDIAVSNYSSNSVSLLRNISTPGNISFTARVDSPTVTQPYGVLIADFDNDGKPDIAIGGLGSDITIYRNTSTLGFMSLASHIDVPLPGRLPGSDIQTADLNGDGKLDLVAPNNASSGSTVSLLMNISTSGTISFAPMVDKTIVGDGYGAGIADFDGDGKPDLAITNWYNGNVSILRNLTVRQDGLVAWYPFNGNANDSSGNGNNGTSNGATFTTDRFGVTNKGIHLDGGATSYINCGNGPSFNIASAITVTGWFKVESITYGPALFSKWGSYHGFIDPPDANLDWFFPEARYQFTFGFPLNQWTYFSWTYDGSAMKFYKNSILNNIITVSGVIAVDTSQPFVIGGLIGYGWNSFPGSIDDIRVYNRALSASEIDTLYNEGGWASTTWQYQLKAAAGSVVDNNNYLGVSYAATDTLDQLFDIPKPPLPSGSYVQVYFPHPEWGSILGNNFASDIKKNISLTDTIKRWYFQVKSNVLNDTVKLTFVNDRVPSQFGKYLTDLRTGKRINLNKTALYQYYNTSDTARSFMIIIGDSAVPQLTLTSPNGSNIWRSGTNKNIAWSTSDGTGIDSVFVYSSSNGGSSYSLLKSLGPVQSTSWTVPGEYLNNNYSIKIVSRDSLGNQSITRSAKTFTVVGDSLATSNSAGWSLISSPLTPNDSSIANMFGTASYLWYYTQATGYTQPSKIALGNGYWLGVIATKNWFVKGIASEADSSIQNLQLGYNLIGNNFVRNVSKSNLYFLKSGSYYDFNSAVTAGLISNSLYGYSSLAYFSIDTMSLFGGYWIGVLQSGVQLIQKPNVSILTPLAKQMQPFAMNWDLPISVSTPSLADNIAAIGIKPTTTIDFDPQYDAPRPPRNPGDKYLEMYFTHTGGNYPAILGSKYAKDYRGSANPVWSFTIESSEQGTVTLNWDPTVLKQLGGNVKLALTDQGTLHSIDMSAQSSYSFNYSSPRSFTIASTITGVEDNSQNKPTSYALRQNYPNPFNPSTQIEFSIPQSSYVTLKVFDVLGKEIATLVNGTMEIGTYTATWNAQNCPSGVYFYRLTAGSYTMTRKLILLR